MLIEKVVQFDWVLFQESDSFQKVYFFCVCVKKRELEKENRTRKKEKVKMKRKKKKWNNVFNKVSSPISLGIVTAMLLSLRDLKSKKLERGERKEGRKRGKVRSWKNEVSVYERKKRKWKRDKCCNWETSPISDGRLLIKFKSSSLCKKENHEIFFENERNKNRQSKEKKRGNIFLKKRKN